MKKITLLLAAILAVMPISAKSPKSPTPLKVISFNIRMGEAEDGTNSWKYRYGATYEMIKDQMPDIMGLQEAYVYQVKFIQENFKKQYGSLGVGREDGKHEGEHMEIFYNKNTIAFKKGGTFWLSETPEKPSLGWDGACLRTATWALLKDKRSGNEFFYVNTHLDHVGQVAREQGLALILEKIAKINPKGLPLVLTGDFNLDAGDPALNCLKGKMLSAREIAATTDKGSTFNGWGHSSGAIDHIYETGFSSCSDFSVIRKKYADRTFISDHWPVCALLYF
ncbi:MAG: endonuclease/exonuclease/phosphatase family protein [Bacteroidales bacterium]|nr:endonuclease/exonuclease/phosphatase family protein [Bacteroidales bacterium]